MQNTNNRDQPEYQCPICFDFGWVYPQPTSEADKLSIYSHPIRCKCKFEADKKERMERLMKFCGLPAKTEHKTLANFKDYGNKSLKLAFEKAESLANKTDNVIFLTLLSLSDRGKSHLGVAVCREWLARNEPALYVNAPQLLNKLKDGYDAEGEEKFSRKLNLYSTIGLLVMDDLGTEKITGWGAEQLQSIINTRYDNALHTVITSNRPIDDLFNHHDYRNEEWRSLANMRVQSRLKRESWCHVVLIDADAHMNNEESK